ncbi:MAG: isocitrate/isopropylmalate family dehydrogenase [Thermoplasmataceae archaeon]
MEIMVLQGDGIGPEIMSSSIKILKVLRENYGLNLNVISYDIGAETVKSGKWTLEKILEEAEKFKAILKAPMGDPRIRNRDGTEAGLDVILGLRFNLGLFANIRPIRLLPGVSSALRGVDTSGSINYTIVRENSEGLYSSHFGGLVLKEGVAVDNQIITRNGTERITRFAFDVALKSSGKPSDRKKEVICVDKSNVLKSFAFFRAIFKEVAKEFQSVETRYMYADAMAQYMILHPGDLNVVVTENMFGDILSDLGAATVGGLGFASSANLSNEKGMFEPVHGSAVDIAGKGIANPTAMILSTLMMIEWLGYKKVSDIVERSLFRLISEGSRTPDMAGSLSTAAFIDRLLKEMEKE